MSQASPGGSQQASHGGGEHASTATYIKIAVVLSVVTALEVGVVYVRQLAPIIVPLLIATALAKFVLVVLFFMHLRDDSRVLSALFAGPLVIAIGITIALMTLTGAFLVFNR